MRWGGWHGSDSWGSSWQTGSSDSWGAMVLYGGGNDASGDWGDAARSQRKKGKARRGVEHMNPLSLGGPQTTTDRMWLGQSYLKSGNPRLTPGQLILQIANGDFRGMAVWWDAPEPLQQASRQVLENGGREFEFLHDYAGGRTRYSISFETMTSTNTDSGTRRAIRVSAGVMW